MLNGTNNGPIASFMDASGANSRLTLMLDPKEFYWQSASISAHPVMPSANAPTPSN
jgi:hypothetical protein